MEMQHMTDSEMIVMKCIWDAATDVSLVQIMQTLKERHGRDWKRQTVSTFLFHLTRKGFLTSYRQGRVFYYHPEIDFREYRRFAAMQFVGFWYENTDELIQDVTPDR